MAASFYFYFYRTKQETQVGLTVKDRNINGKIISQRRYNMMEK